MSPFQNVSCKYPSVNSQPPNHTLPMKLCCSIRIFSIAIEAPGRGHAGVPALRATIVICCKCAAQQASCTYGSVALAGAERPASTGGLMAITPAVQEFLRQSNLAYTA